MTPAKSIRTGIRLPALLGCCLLLSCTVLEDREGCPCRLRVEVQKGCGLDPDREARLILRSDETSLQREETLPLSRMQDLSYEVRVPKGAVEAGGYVGRRNARRDGIRLMIPTGKAADSLYWVSGSVDAVGETAILPLRIRKEHVCLRIEFLFEEPGPYPYRIDIRSTTAGIDLSDGHPIAGTYRCRPDEPADGVFETVLPRQLHPEDLVMEIRRKSDAEGAPLKEIPLGTLISRSAVFSWDDEDLKDLSLHFDFAHSELLLEVRDWELGEEITCII